MAESAIKYTAAYWRRAINLVESPVHKCEDCGQIHGQFRITGTKHRVIVRVTLDDPTQDPSDPANIGLFCTDCRKVPKATKLTGKQISDLIGLLFPE